jgi:RHS repeat-associated protein
VRFHDDNGNGTISSGELLSTHDYYPFGMEWNAGSYQYTYNGKEIDDELGLEWFHYGARMYDPVIGRWNAVDPMAHVQESISTYAFSLNSPIIYSDPDGSLPILINGRAACRNCRGNDNYWGKRFLATIANSGIPNPGGELHFVDGDQYFDNYAGYSSRPKNQKGTFLTGNHPGERQRAGFRQAKDDFKKILAKLAKDPKSGKIIEQIQVYSHSRGSAFAEGYVRALKKLIAENADLFQNADNVINLSLNISPHQSWAINTVNGVPTFSMHHNLDPASGNSIEGAMGIFSSNKGDNMLDAHNLGSFIDEVSTFLSSFNQDGASKSTIDNFVRKMQVQYGVTVTVN